MKNNLVAALVSIMLIGYLPTFSHPTNISQSDFLSLQQRCNFPPHWTSVLLIALSAMTRTLTNYFSINKATKILNKAH